MAEFDTELVHCFCDEAADALAEWEKICLKLNENSSEAEFDALFRLAHNLKGSSRAVGLESFGTFVHGIEDVITELRDGRCRTTKEIVISLLKAQELLSKWLEQSRTNPLYADATTEDFVRQLKLQANESKTQGSDKAKEATNKLDQLITSAANEVKSQDVQDVVTKSESTSKQHLKSVETMSKRDETLRVSSRKLDDLLDLIGELSIHQSIVSMAMSGGQLNSASTLQSVHAGQKITKELYAKALSLRMLPLQSTFQRLERTIKELAVTVNKEIEVSLSGTEVECEKTVVEKIIEPLIHIVRNAVDHGMELPADRLLANKSQCGSVRISARQDSNGIQLCVEDDGKGIDDKKVLQKAIKNGMVSADAKLQKEEIFQLIFMPGFSTAEKITDLSGRGVGLDVVSRCVEELQGKLDISSELGKGTKFTITLPTSLSLVETLIVKASDVDYAIPINIVDEIVDFDDLKISSNQSMIKHKNLITPVLSFDQFLKQHRAINKSEVPNKGIVVRYAEKAAIFKVDQIVGQQQIVIKKLAPGLRHVFGLSGGTILSSGQPGLVVDLYAIARKYFEDFNKEVRAS